MFSYPQKEPIKSAYSDNQILPRSTLGYATNNIYHSMPPRMDDSRSLVAAYQPEAVLNESLLNKSGVKSNWEYRKYLTEHSQEIAKDNFREAANDAGYFERFTPNERGYQSQTHSTPLTGANYKESSTILPSIASFAARSAKAEKRSNRFSSFESKYSFRLIFTSPAILTG